MEKNIRTNSQEIIKKLTKLKKWMDKRAKTSFFNLFVDDGYDVDDSVSDEGSIFDILLVIFDIFALPRKRKAKKILKSDYSVKQDLSALMQLIYSMSDVNIQGVKIDNIQKFLQITLELDNSIMGKKDKEYVKLIDSVIQDMTYNLTII